MPLSYQASLLTGLSTLAKVTEYGSDAKVNSSTGAVTGSALPSQSFDASNGPWAALSWSHPGAIPSTGAATPAALGPVTLSPLDTNLLETSPYLTTGDINGDGRTNTVFVPPKTGNGDPTNGCVLTVIIIFGDGDQKPSVPGNPGFPVTSHLIIPLAPKWVTGLPAQDACGDVRQALLADVYGDSPEANFRHANFPLAP